MGSHPLAAAELGFDTHRAGPFQIEAKGTIPPDGFRFIAAVKSRTPTTVGIDIAARSDVILHLTDIAVRTGRKLTWDPVKEELVADPEASRLLWRPLREPWRL